MDMMMRWTGVEWQFKYEEGDKEGCNVCGDKNVVTLLRVHQSGGQPEQRLVSCAAHEEETSAKFRDRYRAQIPIGVSHAS